MSDGINRTLRERQIRLSLYDAEALARALNGDNFDANAAYRAAKRIVDECDEIRYGEDGGE